MELKNWIIPAAAALALGWLAVPARSAPMGAATGALATAAGGKEAVEQVHGRKYRYGYYRYHRYYRPYRHRRYHYYGYRPGIYLHFGPRRHHRHHRRYWRW